VLERAENMKTEKETLKILARRALKRSKFFRDKAKALAPPELRGPTYWYIAEQYAFYWYQAALDMGEAEGLMAAANLHRDINTSHEETQ
jgi:hypothetical protein